MSVNLSFENLQELRTKGKHYLLPGLVNTFAMFVISSISTPRSVLVIAVLALFNSFCIRFIPFFEKQVKELELLQNN